MQSANVPPEGQNYWQDEDPEFSFKNWQQEVANGDTRAGYWEWAHAGVKGGVKLYQWGGVKIGQ